MMNYKTDLLDLRCMDCMEIMAEFPDKHFDAIITDPPYFKVIKESWDRQWKSEQDFLDWMKLLVQEWKRVLKPNGSIYVFAYPNLASKVEISMSSEFNVLNHIVWVKSNGWWKKTEKEAQRSFFPQTERIIFAEHYGADNMAKEESTYAAALDKCRSFVFAPIRDWLVAEKKKSGLSNKELLRLSSTFHNHYWANCQWALPTEKDYEAFKNAAKNPAFLKEYEELRKEYEELRKEYEELRKEYEELRRPFFMDKSKPSTDVWNFKTEQYKKNRHPCQKPLSLMQHIIETSTRPGALILDCFLGSGSTAIAAHQTGRKCVASELDPDYFAASVERVQRETAQQTLGGLKL